MRSHPGTRRHGRSLVLAVLGAAALLVASSCGGDDAPLFPESEGATTAAGASATTAASAATSASVAAAGSTAPVGSTDAGAIISTISSSLGTILGDRDGRTLYVFNDDDGHASSTCLDQCATNWPPVKASGAPIAAGSVDGSLLGTAPRGDGTLQVTYAGRPLYYFKGDQKAGDTLGQNVGGLWHAVDAKGEKVTGGSTSSATTTAAASAAAPTTGRADDRAPARPPPPRPRPPRPPHRPSSSATRRSPRCSPRPAAA